jgi:hypothetical protein
LTEAADQDGIVLANLPAGPTERRVAFAVALPLLGIAAAVVPFASVQFPRIDGWIPITNTYIFVADLVTWVLLISQFDIARRPALLVLASGYLYTALMAVPLLLSFPGAFTPSGLFGAGSQTNGWLSAFWVSGYPLAFIGYAMLKDSEPGVLLSHRSTRTGVALSVAVSIVIVVALIWITTAGEPYLPKLFLGRSRATVSIHEIGALLLLLNAVALLLLWLRRRSVIPEERRQRANGDRHWTAAIHIRVRRRVTCMAARRSREAAGVTLRLREAAGDFSRMAATFSVNQTPPLKPSPVERSRLAAGPWFLRRL